MSIAVKHNFSSGVADTADATLIQPSHWNDDHSVELATGNVVGRVSAGTGAAEEVPLDTDGTLAADSDVKLATQKAVKTYADTKARLAGGQTLTGGFDVTSTSLGTLSSFTVAPETNNLQFGTNNAAITITAPATDCCAVILITNGASAGAITLSGFSVGTSTGDTYDTTSGHQFFLVVLCVNGVSTYRWASCQ